MNMPAKTGLPNTTNNLNDLSRILQVFDDLSQEMINKSIEGYKNRLKSCIEVNGKR